MSARTLAESPVHTAHLFSLHSLGAPLIESNLTYNLIYWRATGEAPEVDTRKTVEESGGAPSRKRSCTPVSSLCAAYRACSVEPCRPPTLAQRARGVCGMCSARGDCSQGETRCAYGRTAEPGPVRPGGRGAGGGRDAPWTSARRQSAGRGGVSYSLGRRAAGCGAAVLSAEPHSSWQNPIPLDRTLFLSAEPHSSWQNPIPLGRTLFLLAEPYSS